MQTKEEREELLLAQLVSDGLIQERAQKSGKSRANRHGPYSQLINQLSKSGPAAKRFTRKVEAHNACRATDQSIKPLKPRDVLVKLGAFGIEFTWDKSRSVSTNVEALVILLLEGQECFCAASEVALHCLVGAALDSLLGAGIAAYQGYTTPDAASGRNGDFQIDAVVLHVTTQPGEALARKCAENLAAGLRPLVVTTQEGVSFFRMMLKQRGLADRVDVLDVVQFLTANLYERSLFVAHDCAGTFLNLLRCYNELVAKHETDPGLKIRLPE